MQTKAIHEIDQNPNDQYWMEQALRFAREAANMGEVPVGAVLVDHNGLRAGGANGPISRIDPTAHAEIIALRTAANRSGNYRLVGTTLYVTLEPCLMCMGAMIHARIDRLVYGAPDPKSGAAKSLYQIGNDQRLNHTIEIQGGILQDKCANLLRTFFRQRRTTRSNGQ